jgi:hypothetical protein
MMPGKLGRFADLANIGEIKKSAFRVEDAS